MVGVALSEDCDLLRIFWQLAKSDLSREAGTRRNRRALGAVRADAQADETNKCSAARLPLRLCIPQAVTDDPDIAYHHRRNGEYDQIFHLFTSLFDWW